LAKWRLVDCEQVATSGVGCITGRRRENWCGACVQLDALRRREQELWNHDGNNMKWLPSVLAYAYLRDDTSMPTGTTTPLWTFKRGFVSEFVSTWEKWVRNADAILAACPIRNNSRDGLVRLTTWPWFESVHLHGNLYQNRPCDSEPSNGIIQGPGINDNISLSLLAAAWPGVRFELPPAQTGWDTPARSTPLADIRRVREQTASDTRPF
jgi:hypothetical protein